MASIDIPDCHFSDSEFSFFGLFDKEEETEKIQSAIECYDETLRKVTKMSPNTEILGFDPNFLKNYHLITMEYMLNMVPTWSPRNLEESGNFFIFSEASRRALDFFVRASHCTVTVLDAIDLYLGWIKAVQNGYIRPLNILLSK